jgi:hypothetical protein
MEGKQWLLNTGINTMGGVGNQAMNMTNSVNSFNLDRASILRGIAASNTAAQQQQNAQWGQIMSSTIGAASNYYGTQQLLGYLAKLNQGGTK